MTGILFVLACIGIGAFGAAFLRLLYEQPRDVVFVLAGVLFLCLGMKKSSFAKEVLMNMRPENA